MSVKGINGSKYRIKLHLDQRSGKLFRQTPFGDCLSAGALDQHEELCLLLLLKAIE
jgi:hypothetical protein